MFGNKNEITERLAQGILERKPFSELKKLLAAGADVNGFIYEEPLLIASLTSSYGDELPIALLEAGAIPGTQDDMGMTPVMHALQNGPAYLSVVQLLLLVLDKCDEFDDCNRNCIWYSAKWASAELLSELHSYCVSIDSYDKDNRTPLMHASEHANWSSVSWFQNHGSSVHRKDLYGLNALMLASWYNEDPKRHKMVWDYPHAQRDTVRILCAAGAEVDATDGQGQTALMYATFSENIEVAEVLIQAGASTNIRDSEDRTLLDVAKLINSEKMISFYKQINVVE